MTDPPEPTEPASPSVADPGARPAPGPSRRVGDVVATLRRRGFDAAPPEVEADAPLRSLAFHTRDVTPGALFAALPGASTHGIAFADDALERGAVALLSDRNHPRAIRVGDPAAAVLALGRAAREAWRGPVVGVTGSAGKTTTRALLAAALGAWATPGNYNTPLALAATVVGGAWIGRAADPLVLELGIDRPGEMQELTDLTRPEVGVITLIAASHLDALGSVAAVAREKGALLAASEVRFASLAAWRELPPDLREGVRVYAVSEVSEVGDPAPRPDGVAPSDWIPGTFVADPEAPALRALGVEVALPVASRAVAENALAALVVASDLGVAPGVAAERIGRARLEDGRLTLRRWGGAGARIVDDSYNSNPASAAAALELLRRYPAPRVAVLGSMLELGPEAPAYHRELGRRSRGLERVIAVGEAARPLLEGNPDARWVPDVDAATELLSGSAPRGTLLIKGSRGVRLDRLVAALLGESGGAA